MKSAPFPPTFDGWRLAARGLIAGGVEPRAVVWEPADGAQPSLGLADEGTDGGEASAFRVPRRFVEIARMVACHRDPERWALLYRVLWRIMNGERALMDVATDPDIHRLLRMEKAVRRESHKMKAFVRFRAVEHDGGTHYVAWFEPEHDVVELTAPFFAERFASMRWSILTPDRCLHWDGASVSLTPGVARSAAPDADRLEGLWRTYYASTFNPGRARPGAMRAEMPLRYWKNLPEAELIAPLLHDAPARVRRMIEQQSTEMKRAPRRPRNAAMPDAPDAGTNDTGEG
jgi:probable DNA metabolism protein